MLAGMVPASDGMYIAAAGLGGMLSTNPVFVLLHALILSSFPVLAIVVPIGLGIRHLIAGISSVPGRLSGLFGRDADEEEAAAPVRRAHPAGEEPPARPGESKAATGKRRAAGKKKAGRKRKPRA